MTLHTVLATNAFGATDRRLSFDHNVVMKMKDVFEMGGKSIGIPQIGCVNASLGKATNVQWKPTSKR